MRPSNLIAPRVTLLYTCKLKNKTHFLAVSNRKMNERSELEDSPTPNSQQIVSDDDEIDYSSKPEFYDPKLDDNDELWVQKQRRGRTSDAVLSCPACFTTLCLDCQRHEKYVTQYRAIFVVNCRIKEEVSQPGSKRRRNKRGSKTEAGPAAETFNCVCCSVCSTEVGVIDEDEVYHFLNVLPSEA
ncbi:hypothetical protein Pfo_024567 [Paulownia fortunei]|nr:hypothetical protein Pfo_024567 [Paulownia fortunei]